MEKSDELERMLLLQQTHELLCPDCDACVTSHVILRKRKRECLQHRAFVGRVADSEVEEAQSPSSQDGVQLSKVLVEQETHDLFCPICEYTITGAMILQKRKFESEPLLTIVDRLRSIEEHLDDLWTATRASFADFAELNELHMRRVLYEQSNYELLCPDCDACITPELIFQKRKRGLKQPNSGRPQGYLQASTVGGSRPAETIREGCSDVDGAEFEEEEKEDPPLKRQRRGFVRANSDIAKHEEAMLRGFFQEQQTYDITCPVCHAVITYNVGLRRKVNQFVPPESKVQKASFPPPPRPCPRGWRRSFSRKPWKTRYKLFYRGLNPEAAVDATVPAAESDDLVDPYQRRIAHSSEVNRSLAQPLLLSEGETPVFIPLVTMAERLRAIRHCFMEPYKSPTSWIYIVTLLFLWLLWLFLRQS